MTILVPAHTRRELRHLAARVQVANARDEAGDGSGDRLPDSPSAVIREAIWHLLDRIGIRSPDDRVRTDDEWDDRLARMKRAIEEE